MLIRFLRRNKEYRRNKFTTLLSAVNMSAEYETHSLNVYVHISLTEECALYHSIRFITV